MAAKLLAIGTIQTRPPTGLTGFHLAETEYDRQWQNFSENTLRQKKIERTRNGWTNTTSGAFSPLPVLQKALLDTKDQKLEAEASRIAQKLREDDRLIFGTSLSVRSRSPGEMNAPAGTAYFDRKMRERRPSIGASSVRKDSTSSTINAGASASGRPARLARQISFGLRGFGGIPPKASASHGAPNRTREARPDSCERVSSSTGRGRGP